MNKHEPDWLSPQEYQIIVAPSLKVSAELAASRGDPKLFQDLPSMLSLIYLVSNLRDYYIEEWVVLSGMSSEAALAKAPEAACMMVLTEGNVGKSELAPMMDALSRSYQQVCAEGVCDNVDVDLRCAWESMKKGEHEQFLAQLEQVAKRFVTALDDWEKKRDN
ncbi:MAG: hypothetical protein A6F72_02005 [Cycloclasticus sp. symbiont of Poecilosclerida sp. N]|nr:MAG: hypothetical protein A6F72_02005 [Cycloclasticus sp. symbiont of Poecilosclerida sp. N]